MTQLNPNQTNNLFNPNNFSLNEEKILILKSRIKKLSDICQDLNPYQEISSELKMKLAEFQILELSDPFKITNSLLILLEDTIDELHILEPLTDFEKNNEIL